MPKFAFSSIFQVAFLWLLIAYIPFSTFSVLNFNSPINSLKISDYILNPLITTIIFLGLPTALVAAYSINRKLFASMTLRVVLFMSILGFLLGKAISGPCDTCEIRLLSPVAYFLLVLAPIAILPFAYLGDKRLISSQKELLANTLIPGFVITVAVIGLSFYISKPVINSRIYFARVKQITTMPEPKYIPKSLTKESSGNYSCSGSRKGLGVSIGQSREQGEFNIDKQRYEQEAKLNPTFYKVEGVTINGNPGYLKTRFQDNEKLLVWVVGQTRLTLWDQGCLLPDVELIKIAESMR